MIETANQVLLTLQSLLPLLARFLKLAKKARRTFTAPAVSYENLLLDITLDLQDPAGRKANVICRQRVRFLVNDSAVIGSPVWGDGNQLAGYEVQGARRLGERSDGPRRVQVLGLDRRPSRNRCATIVAKRRIQDGFTAANEYFESSVERPTKRLRLTVLFPKARAPREAYLVASTGERLTQPRLRLRDGRASLKWGVQSPRPQSVYSLRWAW